jgi:hypothetical protein
VRDFPTIIKALLSKTVARGATVGEAAASHAKAREIAEREGLTHLLSGNPGHRSETSKPRGPSWSSTGNHTSKPSGMSDADWFVWVVREAMRKQHQQGGTGPKAKPQPKPEAPRRRTGETIQGYAETLLMREFAKSPIQGAPGVGYSYDAIIDMIADRFPGSKTSLASLRWYESRLRKNGKVVPKRPSN